MVDPEGFNYCRYIGLLPDENFKQIEKSDELILNEEEQEIYNRCLNLKENNYFSIIDFGARRNYSETLKTTLKKINIIINYNKYRVDFTKVSCSS